MAWMTREDRRQFTRMPNEPDMETLTYWVTRLEPLIRSENKDEIIIVFCNRTGIEEEATYAGTSAVVGVQDGEVKVYGLLGRGEKELLVVDTEKSPYAKLVYRPPEEYAVTESGSLQTSTKTTDSSSTGGKSSVKESKPQDSKDYKPAESQSKPSDSKSNDGRHPASTPAGTNAKFAASGSKPPQQEDGAIGGTPKKRSAPPIKVPSSGEPLKNGGSAKSPGPESYNIPTPSAPSPTPMAVRPRLIIPESPPIQPYQYPPDHPMSAASLRSEKSAQSFKSDESEASVQTIRSNPRPPEESTPYPHSGAPPSGYPKNAWSGGEKRIYGGRVTISQDDFSPTTPFQDISPASPRYFWRPSDNLLRTPYPVSAGGWTPGTPIGRRPEPFPWPAIKGETQKTPNPESERAKADNTPIADLRNGCSSPQSTSSSNRTAKSARSGSTAGRSSSTTGHSKKSSKDNKGFQRPVSPKSRNASRSRAHGRSNSSLGEREVAAAVTMHLEGISQRAESANSMRKASVSGTPIPDRPGSPKSRNCSRNRNGDEGVSRADPQSITIAASPSIFWHPTTTPEARNFYHAPPATNLQQRTNSSMNVNHEFNQAQSIMSTVGSNIPRPASRAASRGRQPGPQPPPPERATSQDSTRNDRLHTRVSRRESRAGTDGHSSRNGRRLSNQNRDLSQFQRVESVVCPNCPVHGRRSTSGSASERDGSPEHSTQDVAGSSGGSRPPSIEAKGEGTSTDEPKAQVGDNAGTQPEDVTTRSSQIAVERNEASDYSSSGDTPQTISTSSSGMSPATPSLFDPPTPKAMAFNADEANLDSIASDQTPTTTDIVHARCADNESVNTPEIRTTVA